MTGMNGLIRSLGPLEAAIGIRVNGVAPGIIRTPLWTEHAEKMQMVDEAQVWVEPEEVAEALSYALRYDERGKLRRSGWDFAASLAAEQLTEHLRRSGFVIMKAPPSRPHSAG